MGMAASQARFLQLTARRSNIEFQGQQINQTRMALANASAGSFERMLSLSVPTPPSSQDDKYYTQGYKFTDPKDEVQKVLKVRTTTVAGTDFTNAWADIGTTSPLSFTSASGTTTVSFSAAQLADLAAGNPAAADADAGTTGDNWTLAGLYNVLGLGALPEGNIRVFKNVTVEHDIYTPDGELSTITVETPALLEFDNLNRLHNTTLLNQDVDLQPVPGTNLITAGTSMKGGGNFIYSGVFDEATFQDDMNRYEFQKATYDYQIERINQETKRIQQQDKSLELKMKQLDTEHNAVQTEMEAVQKVINKNIETTFKTFG